MRILLVEDHFELAGQVRRRLEREGFAVDVVATAADALETLGSHAYSVALVDRRLPDGDGLQIVSGIKGAQSEVRVLVLTALDAIDQRIAGLDAGADDYLIKPFDFDELMARIRAVLRRPGAGTTPPIIVGDLAFHPGSRNVTVAGKQAVLHQRELALLEGLMCRAGRVVERERLISEIWGFDEDVQSHALTITVSRLRARLNALGARAEIHMVRGVGYFISEAET